MPKSRGFTISGKVVRYTVEPASWYFVYLDDTTTAAVREARTKTVGFRYVPVEATVGATTWQTTLFPTKEGPYLLALKAKVRQAEGIREGQTVIVKLKLK
jgi:hypothetical protein